MSKLLCKDCELLLVVLKSLLECPYNIEPVTVPKAGVDANPEQVVGTMHIGYVRYQNAKATIAKVESRG